MRSHVQIPSETKHQVGFFSSVLVLVNRVTRYLLLVGGGKYLTELRCRQVGPSTAVIKKKINCQSQVILFDKKSLLCLREKTKRKKMMNISLNIQHNDDFHLKTKKNISRVSKNPSSTSDPNPNFDFRIVAGEKQKSTLRRYIMFFL